MAMRRQSERVRKHTVDNARWRPEVVREIVRERVDTAEKVARRKVLDELVAEAQELGLYPAPEAVSS